MEDNYQGWKIKELPGMCPNNIYFSLKYCRNLKATLPKAPPPPDWREIYRIEKEILANCASDRALISKICN